MKILGFFFECYVVVLMIKGSSAGQGRHVKQVDTWTGNSSLLWPRGVVHYFVADHNSADIKSIITGAIQTVLESFEGDCLQIQQLEIQPQRGPYIHLPYSDPEECSSDLGRQKNGPTYVELGLDCSTSDVALQLLVRALGAGQNDSRDWNEINAVLEKSSNLKAKFSMNAQYGHSVPGLVELGKMYNCTVKADIKEFYAILIEQQIFKVMENFDMCIDNMTEVGECKEDEQKLTSLVEELKNSASNSTDHHHKTQFKQALKFLTQREEMIKLKIDIKDLRENNEKLQQELDKQAEHDQKLREKLQQDMDKQAEHFEQKLSDQLELIRGVFNKPWFGEPDVKIYNSTGYQVIETKSSYCYERFPIIDRGANLASINSQAELDFITELLGDRKAATGGWVDMSTDRPSYSGFQWPDGSSTQFFHTLEKKFKFKDGGAGLYYPYIQSGEIYFEDDSFPDRMVCEYH